MKNKYTVDYFIKKFEKIPQKEWTVGEYVNDKGKCCALGHCGAKLVFDKHSGIEDEYFPEEAEALKELLVYYTAYLPSLINDGDVSEYNLGHPKKNILAALGEIKKIKMT